MKITKRLIAIAVLGLFPTTTAWAAQETISDEPEAATNQEDTESPSDAEVTEAELTDIASDPFEDDIGEFEITYGDPCCTIPRHLFPTSCGGLNIGGWLQMGYHTEGANGIGVAAAASVRGPFNNYPNALQLQQGWFFAEKKAETYGYGLDWGFRFDYVYGTDGQDAQSIGNTPGNWDTTWDAGNFYGHALPQLYAEVAYDDLSVKIGRFFTIAGYESVMAPQNFFYSHSASFLLEPFAHTGFLAEWDYSDNVTLYGGWTMGWDTGYERNGGDAVLGGFSLQLTDAVTFAYYASMGDFGMAATRGSDSNGYFHTMLLDCRVTDRLTYVLQTDYLDNALYTTVIAAPIGPVLTVNQYLLYEVNDRWAFGARFDWLRFDGTQREFANFTFGANYRPHPNVVIRPELRYDDFDNLGLQDSTTLGIDAILTF